MKARDLSELAVRNLREALLRNSLTTLGIAVGVASLVAMLSLGVGLQALASQRLMRSGLFDAVFVTSPRGFGGPGGGPGGGGGGGPARAAALKEAKPLDEDARRQLAQIPNVTEVYPQIRFAAQAQFGGSSTTTSVLGLPESSRASGAFEGMKGRFFASPQANEVILQKDFASELSTAPDSLIGKDLVLRYAERGSSRSSADANAGLLNALSGGGLGGGISVAPHEQKFHIAGIIESDPSAGIGGFGGARVFLPLATAEALHVAQPSDLQSLMSNAPSKPSYLALTVRAKSPKDVQQIEDAIKKQGFQAFSLLDATKGLRIFFTVFDLLLGLFGSLALTVASLGIINTLVMAILERRREIGILKALGATDGDVKRLFFAEAAAMGFLGGLLGVVGGWLIGRALTLGTTIYLKRQDLPGVQISSVPWWLALSAIGFAIVVSLAAGLYPAARAAKLNPVEALRYE
ncbi:MAG TPA: ABC transporter permease [Candidatus Dormibacteraeota bacterium]|nr:ABC transporter permease [Candidatus Dormibacteraeota bacterium]